MDKHLGLCTVSGSTLIGLRPTAIQVEVCCTRGPAFFQMVGLAQAPVREARVRVTSALSHLGVLLEQYAITINLAPAELRKNDAALDLPIALGVLGAIGRLEAERLGGFVFLGELSLDGRVQAVRGVLPQLTGAVERGVQKAVVPKTNAREAGLVEGLEIYLADSLSDVTEFLQGRTSLQRAARTEFSPTAPRDGVDLSEVQGQPLARRALEVAAAGGHNLLMIGPPGAGKTMLARRLPTLLPELSYSEALETTAIHSVAGLVDPARGVVQERPFRAPHHTVTEQGLVGGGEAPRPGELSLAHNGVLFLDELPEFQRRVLESLRQPLEDGVVTISRARGQAQFPACPVVVAAMNPCPCGFFGHPQRLCRCSDAQRSRYRMRLSGPLLDRLDVHVMLPPVQLATFNAAPAESSAVVRARVLAARRLQQERYTSKLTSARTNGRLPTRDFELVLKPTRAAQRLLGKAADHMGLSARGFGKVLRVARTIADLEAELRVQENHVAEALHSRLFDREM